MTDRKPMPSIDAEGLVGDTEALGELLLAKDYIVRVQARGIAASWQAPLWAWMDDELHRPDADPAQFMHALCLLQLQVYASIVAQTVQPSGFTTAVDLYRMTLDKKLLRFIEAIAVEIDCHKRRKAQ